MRLAALALCLGLASGTAHAQTTPREAADRFLELNAAAQLQSDAGRAIRTGEALEWEEPQLGPLPTSAGDVVAIDAAHAVARVTTGGDDFPPIDLYFYLDDEGGWKVSAFRTLALTGLPSFLLQTLQEKGELTAEEAVMARNLELTLATDASLKLWHAEHLVALEAMAGQVDEGGQVAKDEAQALGLVSVGREEFGVVFMIGGIVDNTVGFLKEGPSGPPTISPSEYIWVEALGGGWYLFRTT